MFGNLIHQEEFKTSTLPETWCVKHTGLTDFEVVKNWLADYDPASTGYAYYHNYYYGVDSKRSSSRGIPFGTVLTLEQFKAAIQ